MLERAERINSLAAFDIVGTVVPNLLKGLRGHLIQDIRRPHDRLYSTASAPDVVILEGAREK